MTVRPSAIEDNKDNNGTLLELSGLVRTQRVVHASVAMEGGSKERVEVEQTGQQTAHTHAAYVQCTHTHARTHTERERER